MVWQKMKAGRGKTGKRKTIHFCVWRNFPKIIFFGGLDKNKHKNWNNIIKIQLL